MSLNILSTLFTVLPVPTFISIGKYLNSDGISAIIYFLIAVKSSITLAIASAVLVLRKNW